MSKLPVPQPPVELGPPAYWDATAAGTLTVAYCRRCDRMFWYPRPRCPACMSDAVRFIPVSGEGSVYSYTVNRRPAGAYHDAGTVVLAYVELAEGPRVLTNIIDVEPADVRIGMPVKAVFDVSAAGTGVLRFGPVAQGTADVAADGEGQV